MDPVQPAATAMPTVDASQQQTPSKQEEEQVLRLRGGGCFTDCLAYAPLSLNVD